MGKGKGHGDGKQSGKGIRVILMKDVIKARPDQAGIWDDGITLNEGLKKYGAQPFHIEFLYET